MTKEQLTEALNKVQTAFHNAFDETCLQGIHNWTEIDKLLKGNLSGLQGMLEQANDQFECVIGDLKSAIKKSEAPPPHEPINEHD